MARGKKFNAAEKHFAEKELRMRRELRTAEMLSNDAVKRADALMHETVNLGRRMKSLLQRIRYYLKQVI